MWLSICYSVQRIVSVSRHDIGSLRAAPTPLVGGAREREKNAVSVCCLPRYPLLYLQKSDEEGMAGLRTSGFSNGYFRCK